MIKKTITFEDTDGNQLTEDFYFHISKAELVEMEVSEKEGLGETLKAIVAANDGNLIVANFKKIILLAYGVRSDDRRQFNKSEELRNAFASTDAYSQLFVELATDAKAATEFINGIIPASLAQEVSKANVETQAEVTSGPKPIQEMTREELIAAFGEKAAK